MPSSYNLSSATFATVFAFLVIFSIVSFSEAKRDSSLQSELRKMRSRSARRGCSSFGHSCFGGHGKRSGGSETSGLPEMGQDEVAQRPVYPQNPPEMFAANDMIPIRNGGFMENIEEELSNSQFRQRLNPLLRHWLIAYRRSLENGDAFNN